MMKNTLVALGVTLMLATAACGETPPPASPESNAGAPAAAGAAAAGGAAGDADGDGVPDADDKCPDKKEDGIGKEPKDGCPDGHAWTRTHPTPTPN